MSASERKHHRPKADLPQRQSASQQGYCPNKVLGFGLLPVPFLGCRNRQTQLDRGKKPPIIPQTKHLESTHAGLALYALASEYTKFQRPSSTDSNSLGTFENRLYQSPSGAQTMHQRDSTRRCQPPDLCKWNFNQNLGSAQALDFSISHATLQFYLQTTPLLASTATLTTAISQLCLLVLMGHFTIKMC